MNEGKPTKAKWWSRPRPQDPAGPPPEETAAPAGPPSGATAERPDRTELTDRAEGPGAAEAGRDGDDGATSGWPAPGRPRRRPGRGR
ncbi:hypothetical protein DN402_12565 [Streptomyces sp. SW4]|nr:hypothetical protein DN402_12565 [Streptomyces sp. SW4]